VAAGCERDPVTMSAFEKDMIAVPIGPRRQRSAVAASPAYREGMAPGHPSGVVDSCMSARPFARRRDGRRSSNATARSSELNQGPAARRVGGATDLAGDAAIAGTGPSLRLRMLRPHLDRGALEPS